ncbi:uncharacterized protein LOC122002467 [Zingiber officinale]|uniref:uncharacterized protein LOC122002467 n=1 Tax=Zingiber officinale TaxID=94328 RepID=UPI001C4C4D77|nr:uncharacterized protein LOC122002467 [Zingiber officinale]
MHFPRKKPPQAAAGGGSGVSRIVSCLRPDGGGGGGGGSLVVQTGFPTSLADLFLKNRSRLKVPSRKKRKKLPETTASSSADADAPDHVAAFAAPPWGNADAVSAVRQKDTGFGIASGTLLIVAGVMLALAIERNKLVGGIMLFAVVLWLLDSLGFRHLRSRTPRSDASSTASGRWNLQGRGFVSPIREIGIDSCSDSAGSDSSSLDSMDQHQKRQFLLEKRDFSAIRKAQTPKKLLSKLVPKKFNAQRRNNTNQNDLFSSPSGKDDFNGVTEIEEEESTNTSDDSDDSSAFCIRDVLGINASAESIQEHGSGTQARSSRQLVFCAVVLLGLCGGKCVALVLILSWFLLQKSVNGFWSREKYLIKFF